MPTITSAEAAAGFVELLATKAMEPLEATLVLGRLVNRDYDDAFAASGDSISVPIPPIMTTNNLAEGGTVQTQSGSIGNAQVRLSNHREASFKIPDITKAMNNLDLLATYMDPALIAMAEQVESDIFAMYPFFTSNAALGGATAMDEARMGAAETALFNAKVPESQPKYMVVSGTTYDTMRGIPRFSENQTSGTGATILSGKLNATVKNINVYRSNLAPFVSDRYHNIAFSRNAMALVVRRMPLTPGGMGVVQAYADKAGLAIRATMSYDPNSLGVQVTCDLLYGVGVLRNNFAVDVQST